MKLIKPIFFASLLSIAFISCKKSASKPDNNNSNNTPKVDIYLVGGINNKPVTWKNGVASYLSPDSLGVNATAIAVQDSDIYAAGYYEAINISNGGYTVACYWKNGKLVKLSDPSIPAVATGIVVTGDDIYVSGYYSQTAYGNSIACYWKNGIRKDLAQNGPESYTTGIVVKNNIVYISGYADAPAAGSVPVYWKNDVQTMLPNNGTISTTSGIFIDGSDNIYVSGSDAVLNNHYYVAEPTYWKNGTKYTLTNNADDIISIAGIALQGNDIFSIGRTYLSASPFQSVVTYWKNNTVTYLTDKTGFGDANGISINGNDVYIVGEYSFGPSNGTSSVYATYWKNNAIVQVCKTPSSANGIIVIPRK